MVVHGDDFIDVFVERLRDKLRKHKKEKGDSWLACDLDYLYDRINEKNENMQDLRLPDLTDPSRRRSPVIEHPSDDFRDELTDLGLLAAMCYWRENGMTTTYVPPPR